MVLYNTVYFILHAVAASATRYSTVKNSYKESTINSCNSCSSIINNTAANDSSATSFPDPEIGGVRKRDKFPPPPDPSISLPPKGCLSLSDPTFFAGNFLSEDGGSVT